MSHSRFTFSRGGAAPAQLPRQVAEKIAFRNAATLFKR